jgi:penicillin-binding protein 1A
MARKLLEIFQALELEKKYSKEEIMEYYLNKVYFGEGCYGIYTAADTYFGKTPDQLTLAECASIVGITNAPTKYDPFINQEENRKRRVWILNEMYDQGYISKAELDEAVEEEPVFVRTENEQKPDVIYSYYAETVINDVIKDLMEQRGLSKDSARQLVYGGGYQIYSC